MLKKNSGAIYYPSFLHRILKLMHFDEQIMSMVPYMGIVWSVYRYIFFNTSIGWHNIGMIPHLRIEIVTSCGTSVASMLCLRSTLTTKHGLLCNSWMVDTDGWLIRKIDGELGSMNRSSSNHANVEDCSFVEIRSPSPNQFPNQETTGKPQARAVWCRYGTCHVAGERCLSWERENFERSYS